MLNKRQIMGWSLAVLLGAFASPLKAIAAEPTVLITGSNRGIGLQIATVYAERGWNVIATCRTPSKADDLNALAAAHDTVAVEELDVTDEAEIAALAEKYKDQPIDILLNNAAIPGDRNKQQFGAYDFGLYDFVIDVNVKGPMRIAQAFYVNVAASDQKKIINISSTQGSIADTDGQKGNSYFYKSSKTALNMVMHMLANELRPNGITVGLISPGFVDTNFGGLPSLPMMISPRASAEKVVAVIDDYGLEKSGILYSHEGEIVPW